MKQNAEISLKQHQSIVKSVAKEFRGKTKDINCFDANVCKSEFLPTRPWETKYLPGDLFELEARFLWGKHQFYASANREFVRLALRLKCVVCSPIFAVNRPDRVMLIKTAVKQPKQLPIQVYATDTPSAAIVRVWLKDTANLECIKSFSLGDNDSLHVYGNEFWIYLYHPSRDTVVAMLPRLEKLAEHLRLESEDAVDFSALPEAFQKLKPLIEKWAVSDDQERSLLVDEASLRTLKVLVQTVSPHMETINEHLNSFGDRALSDAAVLLGALAECATEARLRLEKSKDNFSAV